MCNTTFASTPQTLTLNAGEKNCGIWLIHNKAANKAQFTCGQTGKNNHFKAAFLFSFSLFHTLYLQLQSMVCMYIYFREYKQNRIQDKENWTILQVGNKILVSEIEQLCKHATKKWLVRCILSARPNFFPKERNVTQQQNIRLGKYVAVGEIK